MTATSQEGTIRVIDEQSIAEQEQEILDGFNQTILPGFASLEAAALVGRYPDTVIRVTASKGDQTRVEDWPIWDGNMTGAPTGVPPGTEEYLQLLTARVVEWLTAPYWGAAQADTKRAE